jgi:hypothetical protein
MRASEMKPGVKRRTELGLTLEQSAKEILAHVKGDAKLPTRRIVLRDEECLSVMNRDCRSTRP